MMTNKAWFVIDFDSTFTQVEALDELGRISLKGHPERTERLKTIRDLTASAMEGSIPFEESLQKRIGLLDAHRDHLAELVERLKTKVSPSIRRNQDFFADNAGRVLIISGGLREFIEPVVSEYGITPENVHANTFAYNENGRITGFNADTLRSVPNSKAELLKELDLDGEIHVIGDGYSDYEIKAAGLAKRFYAFTENAEREQVVQKADHNAPNLDEFLYVNRLPRSLSYPKNRIKVLLLENIHKDAFDTLKTEQYQVETLQGSLSESELAERIKDVSILGIRSKTQITKKVLENARKLKAVGAFCIGTNQIGLDACLQKGVVVFNAPYSNTRSLPEKLIDHINTGNTYGSVNFPNLQLPPLKNAHRLIHLHGNVPGVLAQINRTLAEHNINILGQHLKTNEAVGYVITDIDKRYPSEVIKSLRKIPETINLRVLY